MEVAKTEEILDKRTDDRISFMAFIVLEFGEACKMDKQEGYRYLKKYGGLDYIRRHWWALHTDNPYYVIRNIFNICKKNGGYL